MKKLNEKSWDAFELDSMFTFERGKEKNMASLIQGCIPLVSARKINNGIKGFVDNPTKVVKGGNVISLNNDGDGGAGLAYYQPADFALDTHVTALYPKKDILSNVLIYMTASISKQHAIFGHGRSISLPRAHRIQVMLPVDDSGNPDYDYMEQYTSEMRKGLLMRYQLEYKDIPKLNEKAWNGFEIGQIFKTKWHGKKTYMPTGALVDTKKLGDGVIPRIRVTAQNNGINGFTSDPDDSSFREFKNFVSVTFLGLAFYHPYTASLDMKVHCLQLQDHEMNAFIGLFIVVMIQNNTQGTTYGNQLSSEDLVSKRIFLPVNATGEPDYEYMEQYAKNMMLKKYRQYLEYLEGQH